MRDEIKKARLAALLGLEAPKEPTPEQRDHTLQGRRAADAVVFYCTNPQAFKQRECNVCGAVFAVNRENVACCSDSCRVRYLQSIGLSWDPTRTIDEQWGQNGEPLIVPPALLEHVNALAQTG